MERNQIILERAKNGEIFADIGRDFGISRERIRQIVGKSGHTAKTLDQERFNKRFKIQCNGCPKIFFRTTDDHLFCSFKCRGNYVREHALKDISKRRDYPSRKGIKQYKQIYIGVINGTPRYRTEHRIIMEALLGRTLKRTEHIHHINGNGLDNRIENLEVISAGEHAKLTNTKIWESLKPKLKVKLLEVIYLKKKYLKKK